MLSHIVNEQHDDQNDHLSFVQLAYNSSCHSVVNASPHILLMGSKAKLLYLAPSAINRAPYTSMRGCVLHPFQHLHIILYMYW